MGCHTWTYIKVSALPQERKDAMVKEEIETLKNWWGFQKSFEEVVEDVKKLWKDIKNPEKYAKDLIQEYQEKLLRLENMGFEEYEKEKDDDYSRFRRIDGVLYCNIDFDEPFRVYGYPEETFTNVDELIKWLSTYNPNFISRSYYEHGGKWVTKEGFNQELIDAINQYADRYGRDNLYFEFG